MKKLLLTLVAVLITCPSYASSTLYSNSTSVGIGTSAPTAGTALDLSYNTNSLLLPVGTTGQRPSTGVNGMMRYNSGVVGVEAYYNGGWNAFGTGTITSIATNNGITGGTIIGSGTIGLAPIGTSLVLANPTASSAVPIGTSVSAILDSAISSTQGSLLYRGVSSWTALGPGTSGQVLQSGGASANPSWVSPASAGSSMVLLATATASSSASIAFTSIPTGYDHYEVLLTNVAPATTNVSLRCQVGEGAGPTYGTSNYSWQEFQFSNLSTGVGGSGSDSAWGFMTGSINNTSTIGVGGEVDFFGITTSGNSKSYTSRVYYQNTGPVDITAIAGGLYNGDTNVITALKFFFSSGNIASGKFALYGIRNQ